MRLQKFITLEGKAQPTLNPDWIKENYPATWEEIRKRVLIEIKAT